jgi:hypothetical protein
VKYRIEHQNLDGRGSRPCRVYDLPCVSEHDYWANVTDVACPCCEHGKIRWAEAGYVAGYRICSRCGRHFMAQGTMAKPTLVRVGTRRTDTRLPATRFVQRIPLSFAVQPLRPGEPAKDKVTCGHCNLSWDDAIPTSWTPAPSARCPFEYFHKYPKE